jgi:hypothetical protein
MHFIAPMHPGCTSTLSANTSPEARAMLERNYATNAKEIQAYNTLQRALKQ